MIYIDQVITCNGLLCLGYYVLTKEIIINSKYKEKFILLY